VLPVGSRSTYRKVRLLQVAESMMLRRGRISYEHAMKSIQYSPISATAITERMRVIDPEPQTPHPKERTSIVTAYIALSYMSPRQRYSGRCTFGACGRGVVVCRVQTKPEYSLEITPS
jgi:hypothetical protein